MADKLTNRELRQEAFNRYCAVSYRNRMTPTERATAKDGFEAGWEACQSQVAGALEKIRKQIEFYKGMIGVVSDGEFKCDEARESISATKLGLEEASGYVRAYMGSDFQQTLYEP